MTSVEIHPWGRWLRFNLVGALGMAVQLAMLALLLRIGVPYLAATVLAVESAILQNFAWHERFTWADRRTASGALPRLLRFHLANGAVSLVGNVMLMRLLVEGCGVRPVLANTACIVACSVVNFLLGDRVVFRGVGPAGRPTEGVATGNGRAPVAFACKSRMRAVLSAFENAPVSEHFWQENNRDP